MTKILSLAFCTVFLTNCRLSTSTRSDADPQEETAAANSAPTLTRASTHMEVGCGALQDDGTGTGESAASRREYIHWWGGSPPCSMYLQITDSDGDTFSNASFSCTSLPTGSTTSVNSSTNIATITIPDPGDGNIYQANCTVTDGEDTDTYYIQLVWGL